MTESIRILIVDDHPIVRRGLRSLIHSEPGMELCGEAADGEEVIDKARDLRPDVIVLDLVLPKCSGVEVITQIRRDQPDARILVVTSFGDEDMVLSAIRAGALGYLLKDSSPEQLLDAIRAVYRGEASLHPAVALKLMREIHRPPEHPTPPDDALTERETEVLKLLAQGLSNQAIAARLVISERTVANHIGSILSKLHVANRTQAALYALREGISTLNDDSNGGHA